MHTYLLQYIPHESNNVLKLSTNGVNARLTDIGFIVDLPKNLLYEILLKFGIQDIEMPSLGLP